MKPENAKYFKPMPAAERTAGSQQRVVMRVQRETILRAIGALRARAGKSRARARDESIYMNQYLLKSAEQDESAAGELDSHNAKLMRGGD